MREGSVSQLFPRSVGRGFWTELGCQVAPGNLAPLSLAAAHGRRGNSRCPQDIPSPNPTETRTAWVPEQALLSEGERRQQAAVGLVAG